MKEQVIQKLTEREHVLQRQDMYLGSIQPISHNGFFLEKDKFVWKEYRCVDGLIKIINEIIDNSIDEAVRTDFKHAKNIKVYIDNGNQVRVIDDGRGIPIKKVGLQDGTEEWMPVLAFTHARAGSNFDDSDRKGIGMNGIGSFVTNCFSNKFTVETKNAGQRLVLTCKNNLESYNVDVTKLKTRDSGTTVTFKPDLPRFGLEKIDDLHASLIEQRLIHLAMCFPQITFKFNGRVMKIRNTKQYLKAFSTQFEFVETPNYTIAIMPNETDDFRQLSFVNGLDIKNGGNHIDVINWEVVSRLRDKIAKKFKSIKPGDIKNKLQIIAIFRNFTNARFDSQTKERFTNSVAEVRDFLGNIDWDKIANKLYWNKEFIEPITETYRIKEEFKKRQEAKNLNKKILKQKVKCDKFLAPTKREKYLFLCEGDSAAGGIMAVLGRELIGYFAMRGVPLNAYEVKMSKILANQEFKNIVNVLGIVLGEKDSKMRFENIVLAQDADADGAHISGLLIGFFKKYLPHIIEEGKLKKLRTPVIVLKKKDKIKHFFFDLPSYIKHQESNDTSKFTIKYFKGLGSWKKEELKQLIDEYGMERFIETLVPDNTSDKVINDWLSYSTANERKKYIKGSPFDLFNL